MSAQPQTSDLVHVAAATLHDDPELDAIVRAAPGSLIYYTSHYRAFIRRLMPDVECSVLLARRDGRAVGFLPCFLKTDDRWGTVLNSQPFFGSHGGAMVAADAAQPQVVRYALYSALAEVASARQIAALTIVENPIEPLSDADQEILGTLVIDHRISQFTPLSGEGDTEARIFSRLHVKTRNAVRKGRKAGLAIAQTTDAETLLWLQSVHEESITALGGVPKSIAVFRALVDVFGPSKQARIYVGRLDGRPICGLFLLLHQDTVEYYTPVVEADHRDSQVLSALIVDAMITLANEGYRNWNWGGTWPSQQGVYRFKSRWGAEERPYRYHGRITRTDIMHAGKEEMLTRFPSFYVFRFA